MSVVSFQMGVVVTNLLDYTLFLPLNLLNTSFSAGSLLFVLHLIFCSLLFSQHVVNTLCLSTTAVSLFLFTLQNANSNYPFF